MTRQQRHDLTWPMVALAGMGLAFLLGIFVAIPKEHPEWRSALIGSIVLGVGAVVTAAVRQLDRKVDRQTDVSRETQAMVSRETSPGRHRVEP